MEATCISPADTMHLKNVFYVGPASQTSKLMSETYLNLREKQVNNDFEMLLINVTFYLI